jgi:four helix bundle protein
MDNILKKYLEKNKNINRGYRKLEVWQEGISLFTFVKLKIDTIENISFKTKGQIEGSALSVPSNVSEGYCRRSLKEYIQYITYALSSLGENYSQVFALFRANIIEEEWFVKYDEMHYSLENKLIKFNKSNIRKLQEQSDWHNDYQIREIIAQYNIYDTGDEK